MGADHDRLDALLARVEGAGYAPGPLYDEFRGGLLRHIWIEEKIIIPAALEKASPAGKEDIRRLHLDHGAVGALLIPLPSAEIIAALRGILGPHNRLEEGEDGLYALCDCAAPRDLTERLAAAPEIPLKPCDPRPQALESCFRALGLSGYDPAAWFRPEG